MDSNQIPLLIWSYSAKRRCGQCHMRILYVFFLFVYSLTVSYFFVNFVYILTVFICSFDISVNGLSNRSFHCNQQPATIDLRIRFTCITFLMRNKDATPTSSCQPIRLLDPGCKYIHTLNDKQCSSRSVGF